MASNIIYKDMVEDDDFISPGESLSNPIPSYVYVDSTDRLAATGFVAGDVYKVAVQLNDHTFWKLVNHAPVTWQNLGLSEGHARGHSLTDVLDHTDVNVPSPVEGDLLRWSVATSKWVPFQVHARQHDIEDPLDHNVEGTPTDGQLLKFKASTGKYEHVTDESHGAAQEHPGTSFLGSLPDYPYQAGVSGAFDIQYTRVWLFKDAVMESMETFLVSTSAQDLRFALYSQTVPADSSLGPSTKVAETAVIPVTSANDGSYVGGFLSSSYTIPTTGYYWLAFLCSSTSPKFAASVTFRADYLPRREESNATATFPVTTGTLTNPTSACLFVAIVKNGT